MIYYKIIFIIVILTTITLGAASDSNVIETELDHGWQFSMNLKYVTIEKNKSIDQNGKEVRNFIIKNDRNQTEKAIIIPMPLAGSETFSNFSMSSYIDKEIKHRDLSKLSARSYRIAGTVAAFAKAYDNKTGSNVYLAYFPAWPTDSKSDRAVLIVSTLGEGSYRLFDTLRILKCPDRKEPLSEFLKSSSSEKIPTRFG